MATWLVLNSDKADTEEAINLDTLERIEFSYHRLDGARLAEVTLYPRARRPLRIYEPRQMQVVRAYVEAGAASRHQGTPPESSASTAEPAGSRVTRRAAAPEEPSPVEAVGSRATRRRAATDEAPSAEPSKPRQSRRRKAVEEST